MPAHPVFSFDFDPSVSDFAVSKRAYLAARPSAPFGYIATASLVLDTPTIPKPRILLLQRAASDEDPNKWEPPGGACDDDDQSILHAAARELWEEAGLQAARIGGPVGEPYFFTLSDGKKVCQFHFVVHVKPENGGTPFTVKLNPEEHQRFVWATEGDVQARKMGDIELDFTSDQVERIVLRVFEEFRGKLMSQNI